MKALVLAGGSGTRLRPFTYSMPKQLIPVANRPVLEHCLQDLRGCGVTEVGMIVGTRGDEIEAAVGDGGHLGLQITYIHQDAPRGLAHCVLIARDFLGDEDFVMYLGDNMLVGGVAEIAERFRAEQPSAHVVVTPVPDPSEFGVAEVDGDGRVTALVEKPAEPTTDLAVVGVYFFTPAVHEAVRAIEPSGRGELEITDAIQWLVARGDDVRAEVFGGHWKDTGRVDDVLDCNRELLAREPRRVEGSVDIRSRLVGPVVIEAGAQVIASVVTGPTIIGAGSVVRDSVVGPYTSVGKDCDLHGAGIENSIVLDGVSVDGVRDIYGSLIGRSARVRSAPRAATRHRLVIGDHTQVDVAA